jgi:uncharacterized RDD family membrane protein YckC
LAPLWRRAVASTITGAGFGAELTASLVIVAAAILGLGAVSEKAVESLNRKMPRSKERRARRRSLWPGRVAAALVIDIHRRNWQTHGRKWMRVQRVDAASGGPIGIRRAVIHSLASSLVAASVSRAVDIDMKRRSETWERLKPEWTRIARTNKDDWRDAARQILRLLNENHANPLTPVLLTPAVEAALHLLSITLSPKRQGVADRIAGTVLVRVPKGEQQKSR